MIRSVGIDVHRRLAEVCVVDPQGQVLQRFSVPCTQQALTEFAAAHLFPTDEVALEATLNSWGVARVLTPHVGRVVVSNPLQTKAIAQAKIKTDKVDAAVLAHLLRCRYLPEVWQPDAVTQQQRTLTHRRAVLVAERTRLKNRVHAVLAQHLIPLPPATRGERCDLFSKTGRSWLSQLGEPALPALARALIESDLRLLASCDAELAALDQQVVQTAHGDDRVRLLMTLPGVDYTVALGVIAALGDVSRFPDGDHAAAYLGLVPSTRQSGNRCYHGPITRRGNTRARWLLVQAAQHVARHPGPLGVFFRRLQKKKNHNVAVVATARKLAVIAWQLLRHHEPYRYAQPVATQAKLTRLRIRATGKRRASGMPKGTPRPASYGTGQGTRHVPSLPEVYAKEGLPTATPLGKLAAGERRVLSQAGVEPFVTQIQEPQRRERKPSPKPA